MRLGTSLVLFGVAAIVACSPKVGSAPVAQGQVPTGKFGSWPCFHGKDGSNIASDKGINKDWNGKAPRLLWQQPLTDGGYAGPSSAEGMVFLVDHDGTNDVVKAWRLDDGKEIWRISYPDVPKANNGFSRSTPSYDNGKLYIVSPLGKALCLEAKTGKTLWQHDMVKEFGGQMPVWYFSSSPLIDGNRVVLTPGANDGAIAILDKNTGKLLMKGGSGAPGYATPVLATIDGKRQYVLFLANKVCGIDTATGKELWAYTWETAYGVNAATPLVIGDSVFITSGYNHGCCMIDVKGGQATKRWENKAIQGQFSSPIYVDGHIYGTGDPGFLTCLDPATGNVLWKQPGFEKGALCGVDGTMLVFNGSNGELAMVKMDATSYSELGRIAPLKGQSWVAPIVVDKKAIVRNNGAICVVDLS